MANYITHAGLEKIQNEIGKLEDLLQGEIAKQVGEAAALGDLKENAEYKSIKDKQHLTARRLQELREMISGVQIIEHLDLPPDQVSVGKKVHLKNLDDGSLDVYTILGPAESDIDNDIISYESPIARQLMMKKEGEEHEITVPAGTLRYRIEKIEPCTEG
jgi:transcription elongation factor GreA